jgi:hypothetical protein
LRFGNCFSVGRKSDKSLYQESFATFEEDDVYDQGDEINRESSYGGVVKTTFCQFCVIPTCAGMTEQWTFLINYL